MVIKKRSERLNVALRTFLEKRGAGRRIKLTSDRKREWLDDLAETARETKMSPQIFAVLASMWREV